MTKGQWSRLPMEIMLSAKSVIQTWVVATSAKRLSCPPYDAQWQLLLDLAASYGEIAPGSLFFKDSNEKAKEALTKRLQEYFHVPDDPFYAVDTSNSNKKKGSYKMRADIFPAPKEVVKETESFDELGDDIQESYLDQTPGMLK